jgi:hypothetical protein
MKCIAESIPGIWSGLSWGMLRPDDGVIKFLWNVCQYRPDYKYNIAEDTHIHTRSHENLRFKETRVTGIEGQILCKQKERLLYLPNEKHNHILPFLFTWL